MLGNFIKIKGNGQKQVKNKITQVRKNKGGGYGQEYNKIMCNFIMSCLFISTATERLNQDDLTDHDLVQSQFSY